MKRWVLFLIVVVMALPSSGYMSRSDHLWFDQNLMIEASSKFDGMTVASLKASRLVSTTAARKLASADLIDWMAGDANEITVADDGAGGVTLGIDPNYLALSEADPCWVSWLLTPSMDYVDFPEVAYPGEPDTNSIRVYAVADAAFTVLETVTDLGIVNRINQDTYRIAQNGSGGIIGAAKAVYFTGSSGTIPQYASAKADLEATMPAIGVTTNLSAAGGYAEIMIIGRLKDIKTNYAGWAEGDQLYVSPDTAGLLTDVRPTHPNIAQWIGTIEVVDATAGVILVNTQSVTGVESGTNRNEYRIGDVADGDKTLTFDADVDGAIIWDGNNFNFGAGNITTTGTITGGKFLHDASTYIDKDGSNNLTFTDAVAGTRTLKQLGCPTYKYIKATGQAEGDLHLSDGTNWAVSKTVIKYVRVVTSSTNWDMYIVQNDNGYAADDATLPAMKIGSEIVGNANLYLDAPYVDEDASSEVHLYYLDNSGANTATIIITGYELI